MEELVFFFLIILSYTSCGPNSVQHQKLLNLYFLSQFSKQLRNLFCSSSFGPILSLDFQCSSFKPVHSVIVESRQTKCHIWRVVQGTES